MRGLQPDQRVVPGALATMALADSENLLPLYHRLADLVGTHGPPCAVVGVEIPDDRANGYLVELVHEPVGQAVVVEGVVVLLAGAVAVQRVLADHDLVPGVQEEVPHHLQVVAELVPRLLHVRDGVLGELVEVRGEEHPPEVRVVKLHVLPVEQPERPLVEDDGLGLVQVPPGLLDRVDVEAGQRVALDASVRLVQHLDPVASLVVRGADLGHRPHRVDPEPRVPSWGARVGGEEELRVPAEVAAGVFVPALAAGGGVQVQYDLQPLEARVLERPVDPLSVSARRHDLLYVQQPVVQARRGVRRRRPRQLDQVPVPQRYSHDVEAELGHLGEVVPLDVSVEEFRHAKPSVVRAQVAQAHDVYVVRFRDALEQQLARLRQPQEVLGDEAAAVVHAAHALLYLGLPEARVGLREVAPHAADQPLVVRIPGLAGPLRHPVVPDRVNEPRLLRVRPGHVLRRGEDGVLAIELRVPAPAARDVGVVLPEPVLAVGAVAAGEEEPPAAGLAKAGRLAERQALSGGRRSRRLPLGPRVRLLRRRGVPKEAVEETD
mmetsp:Transcript_899/g.2563  ORF Transcript_899/g.2563 Transcript_899/m.2563 type:complete len:548 (+) Transcript_899:57-1700(+)